MRYLKFNLVQIFDGQNRHYAEIAGNSTETKPTVGIVDGSTFLETDTGDLYVFNETGAAWVKYMALKE